MNAPVVLGLLGSIGTLIFLFELLRRRHLREKYAVLWITVSVTALVLAAVPGLLKGLSDLLGVEVPSNLVFFLALLLLLLATIQHSFEVGRLEERTRTLAEEIALLRLDLEQRTNTRQPPE
ncbi:DUF2304 domain-containing protein [Aeromicrobium sp. UC242_57]|uniref:DUF2304 domain-containing protein n=1 Tax=Aeromicrobium sp. UC242_57 TaxID=3374624 RepID=UPI0037BADF37